MLMCGVGVKSAAHLMKFYLLQWEVMKVKFFFFFFYLSVNNTFINTDTAIFSVNNL